MTWAVDVLKDAEEEPTEKFKILLRTPTNALLGEVNRAAVNVLNVANGLRTVFLPSEIIVISIVRV